MREGQIRLDRRERGVWRPARGPRPRREPVHADLPGEHGVRQGPPLSLGGRDHAHDGERALEYARTRHQDDDYHRVQRQQLVLLAFRDKLMSPEVIPQIPALIATLGRLARTDLAPQELAALACLGTKIDRSAITAQTIDGTMVIPWTTRGGAQVSIPNREVIAPVVDKFLGR